MRFTKLVVATFVCVSFASCMTTKKEEEMRASIQALENKLQEVTHALPNVKSEAENTQRNVQASKSDIEDLKKELSLSQGAIDELRVKLARVQETASASLSSGASEGKPTRDLALEDVLSDLSRRVSHLELDMQSLRDEPHKKSKHSNKYKNASELGKALASAYMKKDYKKVVSLATPAIEQGKKDQLEVALQLRGEAYFAMQDYEKAAADFGQLMDRFPKSEKLPRALLLSGDSFVYLKQPYTARSFYSECVRTYANRDECKASKERLDHLGL